MTNASGVSLMPCARRLLLQPGRASPPCAVMSASSNCVTCGRLTQLACRRGPAIFWMRDSGLALDRAERREIDTRHLRPRRPAPPPLARRARQQPLDVRLDVVRVMRPLAPVPGRARGRHAEFARQAAGPTGSRARVRNRARRWPSAQVQASGRRRRQAPSPATPVATAPCARGRRRRLRWRRCRWPRACRGCAGAGSAAAGEASAAVSTSAIRSPCDTRAPRCDLDFADRCRPPWTARPSWPSRSRA